MMDDFLKLLQTELDNVSRNGLRAGNVENVSKIVDMYKDIKCADYYDAKREYYEVMADDGYSGNGDDYSRRGNDSTSDGRSYARRGEHYVRGHYSRADRDRDGKMYSGYDDRFDQYMDSKRSYRSNKSQECKERMMSTLDDYMDSFARKMEDMMRDSDCQEERATIRKYIDRIRDIT